MTSYEGLKQEIQRLSSPTAPLALSLPETVKQLPIANYLRNKDTYKQVVAYIAGQILSLQGLYNVVRPLNADQVKEVSIILADGYSDLSLSDFALFFHTLKIGKIHGQAYPKVFDRLDLGYFTESIQIYHKHRADTHSQMLEQRAATQRPELSKACPEVISAIRKAIDEAAEKRKQQEQARQTTEANKIKVGARCSLLTPLQQIADGMTNKEILALLQSGKGTPKEREQLTAYLYKYRKIDYNG